MADSGEKLRKILELLKEGQENATKKELADAFKFLIEFVKKIEPALGKKLDGKFKDSLSILSQLESRTRSAVSEAKATRDFDKQEVLKKFYEEFAKIRGLITLKATEDDVHAIVEAALDSLPDVSAQSVRDKLESLEEDERLDASAIKNLPEFIAKADRVIGTSHALWNLIDVEVAGITAGQHLEWDGVKWVPVTPAGGGGTPVWGEALESQDPDGTAFTLANTPTLGSVRLFRGGAYQRAGVGGDYTISGATITLASALTEGEVLSADYSYT